MRAESGMVWTVCHAIPALPRSAPNHTATSLHLMSYLYVLGQPGLFYGQGQHLLFLQNLVIWLSEYLRNNTITASLVFNSGCTSNRVSVGIRPYPLGVLTCSVPADSLTVSVWGNPRTGKEDKRKREKGMEESESTEGEKRRKKEEGRRGGEVKGQGSIPVLLFIPLPALPLIFVLTTFLVLNMPDSSL